MWVLPTVGSNPTPSANVVSRDIPDDPWAHERPGVVQGLVILGPIEGEVKQELSFVGDNPDIEVVDQEVGRPMPM